jgi:hypothetical protein
MESTGCYLVLFLILGATVGALLAEANAKRRTGLGKISFSRTERERSKEFRDKSKKSRSSGFTDLVLAVLLFIAGVVLLVVIIYALYGV